MALPTAEQPGLDEHTPPQMAAWLRETAANTRRHSNPTWCDVYKKPYDPLAAHVAFRLEQAASMIEALHSSAEEWMDHYMMVSGNMAPQTSPLDVNDARPQGSARRDGAATAVGAESTAAGSTALPFTHWSKDPLIPYEGCVCRSCEDARTADHEEARGQMP